MLCELSIESCVYMHRASSPSSKTSITLSIFIQEVAMVTSTYREFKRKMERRGYNMMLCVEQQVCVASPRVHTKCCRVEFSYRTLSGSREVMKNLQTHRIATEFHGYTITGLTHHLFLLK